MLGPDRGPGTAMKRGRGFGASQPQRVKVKNEGTCRVCRNEEPDPAHITPRSIGGCNDPACVMALGRRCHRLYDEHRLDVLPYLTRDEQAHAVLHLGIVGALQRLTNEKWEPMLRAA